MIAEVSEADTEVTNVVKLIAVKKKYTRIDELTSEILNAFVDKIVVYEWVKQDGKWNRNICGIPICKLPENRQRQEKT